MTFRQPKLLPDEPAIEDSFGAHERIANALATLIETSEPNLQAAETKLVTIRKKKQRIGKPPPAVESKKMREIELFGGAYLEAELNLDVSFS